MRAFATLARVAAPLTARLNSGVMRGTQKELICVGKALLNLVPNVDSAVILARPVLDLGLRILWAEQFAGPNVSRGCVE